jgi:hypothetical protein
MSGRERRKLKAGRKLTPDEIETLISNGLDDNLHRIPEMH